MLLKQSILVNNIIISLEWLLSYNKFKVDSAVKIRKLVEIRDCCSIDIFHFKKMTLNDCPLQSSTWYVLEKENKTGK